ncbi:CRISPR-associated endoribonuclease Cas2 [Planctomycetales bacterium]|nr:CRISPR-associated endoribonuclease Cas2 [Planctomycetales bacterium]
MRKGSRNKRTPVSRHSPPRPVLSEYQAVWLFALFDLPVLTSAERRDYARFRKMLLDEGFDMLQYSVYARYYRSEESSEAERNFIKKNLPPDGQVRLLMVTDRQFGKQEIFWGKEKTPLEKQPEQLLLF